MSIKLLAWDTSSKSGALVAMEALDIHGPVKLVTELSLHVDLTHSERLLWGIHQVLESARWKINEIDVLGVGVGPGSFTGLRVGLTTARTLAHTLKKPLVGVSSLAALARPVALHFSNSGSSPVWIVAVTDACKGELFALTGIAQSVRTCVTAPDVLWDRGVVERVVSPEILMSDLTVNLAAADSCWVAVGEGRQRHLDAWELLPKEKRVDLPFPFSDQVQGRYLGLLAWEAFQNEVQCGMQTKVQNFALGIHPRYLRASDAELRLKAGLLKPSPQEPH